MRNFGEERHMDADRLRRLRKAIRVGDKIRCRHMVKSLDAEQCLKEKVEKAMVVAKYPHLVEVVFKEPSSQRKTVSYAEMLMNENRYMLRKKRKLLRAIRA